MIVPFSAAVYRRRHRVENFFERIMRYRRAATRYDNLAETFLGFVSLALLFTQIIQSQPTSINPYNTILIIMYCSELCVMAKQL